MSILRLSIIGFVCKGCLFVASGAVAATLYVSSSPTTFPLDTEQMHPTVAFQLNQDSLNRFVGLTTKFEGSVWASASPSLTEFVTVSADLNSARITVLEAYQDYSVSRFDLPLETILCSPSFFWLTDRNEFDLITASYCPDNTEKADPSLPLPSIQPSYLLVSLGDGSVIQASYEAMANVHFSQPQNAQPRERPNLFRLLTDGNTILMRVGQEAIVLPQVVPSDEFRQWSEDNDLFLIGHTERFAVVRRFLANQKDESDQLLSVAVFDRANEDWRFVEEQAWLSPAILNGWLIVETGEKAAGATSNVGYDDPEPSIPIPGYAPYSERANPYFQPAGLFILTELTSGNRIEISVDNPDAEVLSISAGEVIVRSETSLLRFPRLPSGEVGSPEELVEHPMVGGIHYVIEGPEINKGMAK